MSTSRPSLASRTAWDGVSRSFGDVVTSRCACTRVAGPLGRSRGAADSCDGGGTAAAGGGTAGAGVAVGVVGATSASITSASITSASIGASASIVASGSSGASCALSAGIGAKRAVKSSRELDSCGADVG